jgi:hypothetical protein
MSVLSLPSSAGIKSLRWELQRNDVGFGEMFMRASDPLWRASLEFSPDLEANSGYLKALLMRLRGGVNQLELHDWARPAPVGTMRGVLSLVSSLAAGATSMSIVAANDNLMLFPESFDNAAWTKNGTTVNPDVSIAPDGLFTADRINKDATGFRSILRPFTGVAGATYAASVFGKADTLSKLSILLTGDNAVTLHGRAIFDFVAKTAVSVSSTNLAALGISDFGDGWFSCWLAATLPVVTSCRMYIYPDQYNNTAAGSVFMWGAKVNPGTAPTPYGFGKTLKKGDLLGIGSGTTQQVVMVTEDAVSTSQGNITVQFQPPLRNSFPAGQAVVWDKPKALFRRVSNELGWDYRGKNTVTSGMTLDLIEDWRA